MVLGTMKRSTVRGFRIHSVKGAISHSDSTDRCIIAYNEELGIKNEKAIGHS